MKNKRSKRLPKTEAGLRRRALNNECEDSAFALAEIRLRQGKAEEAANWFNLAGRHGHPEGIQRGIPIQQRMTVELKKIGELHMQMVKEANQRVADDFLHETTE